MGTEQLTNHVTLIATYARVSTARQEEEGTIEGQLGALRDFARERGYTIVKEYIDEGWSGDILARPSLDQLREDAKKKVWQAVLIYDPDRLARRYSYQELVMDELRDMGLEVMLRNTLNDANGLPRVLEELRFEVRHLTNATSDQMRMAMRDFSGRVPGAEISLLFFAGHTSVNRDQTWLVPVNTAASDIEAKAIDLHSVIEAVSSSRVGIILIDGRYKSRAFAGGCEWSALGENVVLSYATQPNTTVAESSADNSVYAAALFKYLKVRGLGLFQLLTEVGLDVLRETNGLQQPSFMSGPIRGFVILNPISKILCTGEYEADCGWAHDIYRGCGTSDADVAKDICKGEFNTILRDTRGGNCCGYALTEISCR